MTPAEKELLNELSTLTNKVAWEIENIARMGRDAMPIDARELIPLLAAFAMKIVELARYEKDY